jgi:acyl-CoA thioesterase-2
MTLSELLDQLSLEQIEINLFRGESRDLGGRMVFGGQVLGQALMAATRTVDPRFKAHSLHAYFLRPGDKACPMVYEVDRIRDGKSFMTRRVVAIQHGRPIFALSASYQLPEEGVSHQVAMPEVPAPETLPTEAQARQARSPTNPDQQNLAYLQTRPLEIRLIPAQQLPPAPLAQKMVWMRAQGELPADPGLHRCLLAYASDFNLLGTALLPHGLSFRQPNLQGASIDHALWFHREFRMDDWLLYAMESPSAANARGFSRGSVFDRQGRLVASVAQEGLMRLLD